MSLTQRRKDSKKYKPYTAYKDSGIEWLGEIPAHWEVKRLKTSASYWISNVDKVPSDDELPIRLCNYTDVYYHDRIDPEMELMETTATPEEIRRFGLRVGDVLITKDSEEWSDIAVPSLVVETAATERCIINLSFFGAGETPAPPETIGWHWWRRPLACAGIVGKLKLFVQ